MIARVYKIENSIIRSLYYIDLNKVVAISDNGEFQFSIVFDNDVTWFLSNDNYNEIMDKWKKCHNK